MRAPAPAPPEPAGLGGLRATTAPRSPGDHAEVTTVTSIVPAALPVDFARLGEDIAALDRAGADRIQWDVMDGQFVPNLPYGADVIAACRPHATCGFEAHVMCHRPEELLPAYGEAGCEVVLVHPETLRQPHATLQQLRAQGVRPGVALSPGTPLAAAEPLLDLVEVLLVMTVNPGFGGQSYLASMEPKIAAARALIERADPPIELEVDGGIGPDTIARAAAAGADVFVSGSALWRYGSFAEGIADLRVRADAA